ncbi:TPA: hypothetical protein MHZ53_21335 [Klebsiella pneumoniae subsp. pneumoniae]|nr:hypothetical protein [Klebsiella pneumoniae subsp. pneumoniae]
MRMENKADKFVLRVSEPLIRVFRVVDNLKLMKANLLKHSFSASILNLLLILLSVTHYLKMDRSIEGFFEQRDDI